MKDIFKNAFKKAAEQNRDHSTAGVIQDSAKKLEETQRKREEAEKTRKIREQKREEAEKKRKTREQGRQSVKKAEESIRKREGMGETRFALTEDDVRTMLMIGYDSGNARGDDAFMTAEEGEDFMHEMQNRFPGSMERNKGEKKFMLTEHDIRAIHRIGYDSGNLGTHDAFDTAEDEEGFTRVMEDMFPNCLEEE